MKFYYYLPFVAMLVVGIYHFVSLNNRIVPSTAALRESTSQVDLAAAQFVGEDELPSSTMKPLSPSSSQANESLPRLVEAGELPSVMMKTETPSLRPTLSPKLSPTTPAQPPILVLVDPSNNLFDKFETYEVERCPLIGNRKCTVTSDARYGGDASARVYFFKSLFQSNVYNLPARAHPKQLYFGISPEAVEYYPWLGDPVFMSQFNHSFGYPRSRAPYHTSLPFGPFVWNGAKKGLKSWQYTSHLIWPDKLVSARNPRQPAISWFAANCQAKNKREVVARSLMTALKGSNVSFDAMGSCLHTKRPPFQEHPAYANHDHFKTQLLETYMFDLAFENAHCREWLTEKPWQPLISGAIPIFYGTKDIMEYIPAPESMIFVTDFNSSRELADYIIRLAANDTLRYEKHLSWRDRDPKTWSEGFWKEYNHSKAVHTETNIDCLLCHQVVASGENEESVSVKPFPPCDENPEALRFADSTV